MLGTYLKIAWRNPLRNKTLSFINIFGLALGMTFAILTGMWIHFQRSFDRFNKNVDRIALVGRNRVMNDNKQTALNSMFPLAGELKNNYPEIERVTRYDEGMHSLMTGDHKFNKRGLYVDPSFLKME